VLRQTVSAQLSLAAGNKAAVRTWVGSEARRMDKRMDEKTAAKRKAEDKAADREGKRRKWTQGKGKDFAACCRSFSFRGCFAKR
jgi:hypothetical protein